MKLNVQMLAVLVVIGVAIVAALFRITTAPERIRMRMEVAKASCLAYGGQWTSHAGREICRR